jgi:hypothetical protein
VLFFVKFFSSDGLLLDILTSIREKEVLQLSKSGKRLDKSQVFISEKSKNLFKKIRKVKFNQRKSHCSVVSQLSMKAK